ncbi:MAG: response regulator transcription factor [Candidatus Saccharimonadales bacterium]
MLVEDEAMIRQLYRTALIKADFNVAEAEDVNELYTKLRDFHPDVVFLDIMLPGVSGLEILKELRNNPAHGCTEAKIIILTNIGQRSIADNATENGADGFIIKADILPKDLVEVIHSLEK